MWAGRLLWKNLGFKYPVSARGIGAEVKKKFGSSRMA
jgi:hypothetical protein